MHTERYKRLREKRKRNGMCISCGQNPIDTHRSTAKCTSCLNKNNAKREVAEGTCLRCFIRPIEYSRSKSYCSKCLDRFLKNGIDYRKNNLERVKKIERKTHIRRSEKTKPTQAVARTKRTEKRILLGLCVRCGKSPFAKGLKSVCEECEAKSILYGHTRRSRVMGGGGSFSLQEWNNLVERFENKCLWCESSSKELTADHVVPVSKGGSSYINNIQPLCKSCNYRKHTKILDFRPFGRAILDWT